MGSNFDPTSNNFLGGALGNLGGRAIGDIFTGGLAEFGRKDPFGLPPGIGQPLENAGLLAGGAMLGGPLGMAAVGSGLGGLVGGGGPSLKGGLIGGGLGLAGLGAQGGLLGGLLGRGGSGAGGAGGGSGGGLGGLLGSGVGGGGLLGSALGGSLLGLGLSKDTSIPNVNLPNSDADIAAIRGEEGNLQNIYGQQNDLLKQAQDADRQNLLTELTTGPEGEAFREKYNNLGLLNSGAFNTGLSNQFGQLEAQQEQDILNQRIAQTGSLANLDASTLSRKFGLEDVGTQYQIAQALQQARQAAAEQQSLIGSGAYLLGGGMGGGMGGGGGLLGGLLGGGGGGAGGGGIGGILGGLGSGLGNVFSGIGNLFGFGGTPGSGTPGGFSDPGNTSGLGLGGPLGLGDPFASSFGRGPMMPIATSGGLPNLSMGGPLDLFTSGSL